MAHQKARRPAAERTADEPHDSVSLGRRNRSHAISRRCQNQRRVASTQKAPRGATVNGRGVLRSVLEAASADIGCRLTDLTVLSAQVDPYRLDTASGHRDGQWVAKQLERLVERDKKIHWRGLHYAIVAVSDIRKPNGGIYVNSNDD